MTDRELMKRAIELAKQAGENGDVPVGAVVAKNGTIVGEGMNTRQRSCLISGHAEIEAVENAEKTLSSKFLDGCVLYVTLEPCAMCAGACIAARLDRIVFGAYDTEAGACGGCSGSCGGCGGDEGCGCSGGDCGCGCGSYDGEEAW